LQGCGGTTLAGVIPEAGDGPRLAAAALGWIIRRQRLLNVQIGLAVLLLLMVLFLATTVDPVYFTAGC
jgi:hypothetical protein